MSNPDRLYIAVRVRDLINNKMKRINFLNTKEARNKEIFLYAVALGINAPTHIDGAKDGYLLDKDLNSIDESLIYACIIPNIEEIDKIADKATIYDYIQKCANTGFKIINSLIDEGSIENLDKRLLAELDDKYEELMNFS